AAFMIHPVLVVTQIHRFDNLSLKIVSSPHGQRRAFVKNQQSSAAQSQKRGLPESGIHRLRSTGTKYSPFLCPSPAATSDGSNSPAAALHDSCPRATRDRPCE